MSFEIIRNTLQPFKIIDLDENERYDYAADTYNFSNEFGQAYAREQVVEAASRVDIEGTALVIGSGQLPSLVDVLPASKILMVDANPMLLNFWSDMHSIVTNCVSVNDMVKKLDEQIDIDPEGSGYGISSGMSSQKLEFGDVGWFNNQQVYDRMRASFLGKNILGIYGAIEDIQTLNAISENTEESDITFSNFSNVVDPVHLWPDTGIKALKKIKYDRFMRFRNKLETLPWHDQTVFMWSDLHTITVDNGIEKYLDYLDQIITNSKNS